MLTPSCNRLAADDRWQLKVGVFRFSIGYRKWMLFAIYEVCSEEIEIDVKASRMTRLDSMRQEEK